VSAAPSASPPPPPIAPPPPPTRAPEIPKLAIPLGARVLVLGDSMVDAGFSQRLDALVKERGGSLVHDAWTSSTTSAWSRGDRLDKLLARKPDVIIVALGANEVSLPSPESNAGAVRSIVARVAKASGGHCLWVGPPIWKGETGIVGVERRNAAPCTFFDSGDLALERRRDGIHTTMKGGAAWADAVWNARVDAPTPLPAPSASASPSASVAP
jgi:lysophospholipase L1-like esterase